ncbi:THUMP-like domain-containing protein [Corynebacterium liangguodongii]|uniref:SAM-dependent methyltransferase n=1 Tax=Corynebacterium liangguodongii TaxID=2079535 RepID=A0A2S0WDV3_9CORY|nr:SAM-dependent methyltransferase [Corynebacterium liangguodongii]AWB83842.1 SAM-dependent methyltransferase [Corynebacterium liangguodongii]PWB98962.1 SAM-dependent methyltransferase [Corynebacterium liangguodongii]
MSFSVEEVRFLAAHRAEIDEVAPALSLTRAAMISDRKILDKRFGTYARAVMGLLGGRRAAAGKFPGEWLTDFHAAQQATPVPVAHLRARRIAAAGAGRLHDVTCSVGTEAPAAAEAGLAWLGSDLDSARVLMARHNLGPDAWLARADALAPVTRDAVVVADPARRDGGNRIADPAKLQPPLPDLLAAYRGRELAVKCAPGIDYSEWDGLVSVVSVDGAVKEACLYTPGLAGGLAREAAVLRSDGFTDIVTSASREDEAELEVGEPGAYIVEPDGAVIRAGLVRAFGARHGLWMLDPHIAFLTGDAIPAGYSAFPVLEAVPLRGLKAALRPYGAGSLEILVRGVDVNPDKLRASLKLKGKRPMAVVVARVGTSAVAYVCGARERA